MQELCRKSELHDSRRRLGRSAASSSSVRSPVARRCPLLLSFILEHSSSLRTNMAVSHPTQYVNASVNIEEQQDDDSSFTVIIGGVLLRRIHTTVTSAGADVEAWINTIHRIHIRRLNSLIVGLDIEWRPNTGRQYDYPVALIQLCIGHLCLIFQLIHADYIPVALQNFLRDNRFSFVGVGIDEDIEKLIEHYNLGVTNSVDLRNIAAEKLGRRDLRQAGLKVLAREVVGLDVEKPRRITMSRWDNYVLTWDQVKYACVDAFLSFEIGRSLIVSQY